MTAGPWDHVSHYLGAAEGKPNTDAGRSTIEAVRQLAVIVRDLEETVEGMQADRDADVGQERDEPPLTREECERLVREVTGDGEAVVAAWKPGIHEAFAYWGVNRDLIKRQRATKHEALADLLRAVRAVVAAEKST